MFSPLLVRIMELLRNRYNKYRWTLRLKTRQNPKDPYKADKYFC